MDWEELLRNHEYDCIGGAVLDAAGNVRAISDGILEISGAGRCQLGKLAPVDRWEPARTRGPDTKAARRRKRAIVALRDSSTQRQANASTAVFMASV